jgi:hypothetical protein
MSKKAILSKSTLKNKKFKVVIYVNDKKKKTVHFGHSAYEDFTTHKDVERKKRYESRHRNDNLNDPYSAGFWSMHLLWNKPTISASIKDIENRFNINIQYS